MVCSRLLSLLSAFLATCARSASIAVLMVAALPALAAAQNGTVTGTVTNAATAAPLVGRSLVFCTALPSGTSCVGTSSTNASGNYSVSLPAGTYVAFTSNFNSLGFVNEIYDNIPCPTVCLTATAMATGTGIVVASGATVTGKNFALDAGNTLTGTVTDAVSGAPVQNVSVQLRTMTWNTNLGIVSVGTNAAGVFTIPGLAPGVYYAFANGFNVGYTSEIYNDILCPGTGCSTATAVNSGAPIVVTAGGVAPIAFALSPGGTISGTVTDSGTSAPLANVGVQAYSRVGLVTTFFGSATTNASGAYSIGGLPTGAYQLLTTTTLAVNEIYNNIPCQGTCLSADAVATGTPVNVTVGATTGGRDFALDPGGSVSGTVLDAGTSAPVGNVSVQLYRQTGPGSGQLVSSGVTDALGVYTVRGVPTGSYFAVAFPPSPYVAEVFGGNPCPFCTFEVLFTGTTVAVTAGATTTGRNFALDAGGTITGTVTNSTTSAPLSGIGVSVFTGGATPRQVGSGTTDTAGGFTVFGLPAGAYYLFTSSGQFANEAYNNVACPNGFCSATFAAANGAAVNVAGGATTAGINFGLAPLQAAPGSPVGFTAVASGSTAFLSWSPPTSGGTAVSYILEAGLSPGTTIGTLPVAGTSLSIPGVGPGTYYLRVRGVNAFGTGPVSGEVALVVGNGGVGAPNAPTNLVAWMSGGRLTMTWTAPIAGPVPTGYILEAGSAVGLADIAAVPLTARSFTFDPIPSGFFFLRVRAVAGAFVGAPSPDMMINVGNVPAPPSPPQTFFVSRSGSTATLTWTAPLIGTATSYIIEAGTATGLANLGVVNTGSTATTLVVPGVPPGTYFLRVRAANALGASPVSVERVLTMP